MSYLLECDAPDRRLEEDRRPGNPVVLGQILPEVLEALLTNPRAAAREAAMREPSRETVRTPSRRGERSLRLVG